MIQRRRSLLRLARKIDCDALVAFEPENLFYMTGFWGEAVGILERGGRTTIIAPELEACRARDESRDCDVVASERGAGLIPSLASEIRGKKACTDCRDYQTLTSLKKSVPGIRASAEPFYGARAVKDDQEVRILKKASRIIDEMFELCQKTMRAGQKESELQSVLMSYAVQRQMFDTGYRSTLNPLIVAGGPNGALPHAQATDRRFRRGDLVVVDLTLRYKGYVSDSTRTFAVGRIPRQARDVYDIVRESQRLGLKSARPGADCSAVDSACREYIDGQGYGEYFVHSTGHGIGLEVHEPPTVSRRSGDRLREDMAITVEPGIYIPGRFGIRIEDSLVVRDRPVVMHRFTKELVAV